MDKFFIQSGAILGAIGVGFGAFGAHALNKMLTETNRLDTYETAVKYQFYHAIALVLVGVLLQNASPLATKYYGWAGYAFLIGTVIFSGSLYIICFSGIKVFGAVAPIGGLAFIVGWLLVFWGAFRQ